MKKLLPFLFALPCSLLCTLSVAQHKNPGGVKGTQVWFHTVRISDGVFGWEDQSGYNTVLKYYNEDDEDEKSGFEGNRNTNFYKTLFFDDEADFTFLHSNFPQITIIAPYDFSDKYSRYKKEDKESDEYLLFSLNARKDDGYVLTNDRVIHSDESRRGSLDYGSEVGRDLRNQPDDGEDNLTFRETNMRIAGYYRTARPDNSIWGEPQVTNIFFGPEYLPDNPNNTGTIDFPVPYHRSKSSQPRGYIPEFIMYKRVLTPFERLKVESYLAMKYALTLDYSLLNSEGGLVWDIDRETDYNNRITGHIRDDSSGLYQTRATTTYEERDGGLEDDYIDTYHTIDGPEYSSDLNLLRGQSSSKNLLYISEELGNARLENLTFTFWGDDDQAVTTKAHGPIAGLRLMSRNWQLRTNKPVLYDSALRWNIDSDSLTFSGTSYNFEVNFSATAPGSTASAVTATPLQSDAGFLEWKSGTTANSSVLVKFGAAQGAPASGAHDYGIYIERYKKYYYYYPVVRGEIKDRIDKLDQYDNTLRLEKKGNRIFILRNGEYSKEYDELFFEIAPEDVDKDFYGSIRLVRDDYEKDRYHSVGDSVTLTSFRHGGFTPSVGAEVELSCLEGKAEEFDLENYPDRQPFLIVDRSGSGAYRAEDVTLYPLTNLALERYKLIFNNVFWDEDGSGTDVFTFGYRDSNLLGFIAVREVTCADSLPATDGGVTLTMAEGSGAYSYRLTRQEDAGFLQEGTFTGDTLTLAGLAFGTYELVVTDTTGTTIVTDHSKGEHQKLPNTFTQIITLAKPACGEPTPAPGIPADTATAKPLIVSAFPVPAPSDTPLTVKVLTPEPVGVALLLYNESGLFLGDQLDSKPTTEHTFTVPLSQAGVYLVKIITPFGEQTKKLIIK